MVSRVENAPEKLFLERLHLSGVDLDMQKSEAGITGLAFDSGRRGAPTGWTLAHRLMRLLPALHAL